MRFIKAIAERIKKEAKRAALTTMEIMILIVVVSAVVGSAAGILTSNLMNMSQHVDDSLAQVTQEIVTP